MKTTAPPVVLTTAQFDRLVAVGREDGHCVDGLTTWSDDRNLALPLDAEQLAHFLLFVAPAVIADTVTPRDLAFVRVVYEPLGENITVEWPRWFVFARITVAPAENTAVGRARYERSGYNFTTPSP